VQLTAKAKRPCDASPSPRSVASRCRSGVLVTVLLVLLTSLPSVTRGQSPVSTPPASSGTNNRVNLLFLDEQVVTRPIIQELMEGFRLFFLEHPENSPEVFVESLDLSRLQAAGTPASATGSLETTAWLKQKYAGKRLDLLVASNARIFPRLVALREQIAPQAWILTMERFGEAINPNSAIPNVAILRCDDASIGALELIQQLFPATQRVAFVGTTFPHTQNMNAAVKYFRTQCQSQGIEFDSLVDMEMSELTRRLQQLPANTVTFYAGVQMERNKQRLIAADVVEYLSHETPHPIIAGLDTFVGRGIVGGVCIQGKTVGRMMAEMTRDFIITGRVSDRTMTETVILDARSLDRFAVPAARIPAGAEVRFQEPGFLEHYWPQTLAGTVIFISQAWLIGALLIAMRRRRTAEQTMERQREQLQHASRLSTLGQYAATLAHELGQPLGAILNNIEAAEQLLSREPEKHLDELREIIRDIGEDDRRAGRVLDSIRAMVRRQQPSQRPLNLANLLQNVLVLVQPTMVAQRINITVSCELPNPIIIGDEVLVQQAVLNLLNNSMQAIQQQAAAQNSDPPSGLRTGESSRERSSVGSIRIHIRPAMSFDFARFDSCVELEILDNGGGIDSSIESSVMEPFFTTRSSGLGMGLSIVQSIMEQHDGQIVLLNQPGTGLTVRLLFPAEPRKKQT
jgi:signal transduction histidine kinase